MSELYSNETTCFWYRFLENVINDLRGEGYNFNQIADTNTTTIVKKRGMSYDFYIKHNMCALEWELNAMINKDKTLMDNFDRNWGYQLNRRVTSYRDLIIWSNTKTNYKNL